MRERLNHHVNAVQIVRFPFRHDTPGLTDGVVLYTPKVGDVLLDAWFEVDEAWNGTNPLADVGTFIAGNPGLWSFWLQPFSLASQPDADLGGLEVANAASSFSAVVAVVSAAQSLVTGGGLNPTSIEQKAPSDLAIGRPQVRVTAANPLKLVVSRDATLGGADPGATQGSAFVSLLIAPA